MCQYNYADFASSFCSYLGVQNRSQIVYDADFNLDFNFAKHLTASCSYGLHLGHLNWLESHCTTVQLSGFCQLILDHICESKMGPNSVFGANLNEYFVFLTILPPLCSCGLNSGHLKAYILTRNRSVWLIWIFQLILGHISEFKIDLNIVSDAEFDFYFDFANHLTSSLLLWFEFRPSQVVSWKSQDNCTTYLDFVWSFWAVSVSPKLVWTLFLMKNLFRFWFC